MQPFGFLDILLIIVLGVGVAIGLLAGVLFFTRRFGLKRPNIFFGLLLVSFSLTLLRSIFTVTGFFDYQPRLRFLPIYFTLAFPPLLFYYVKLNLYPSYRLRLTDAKHFLLPVGQFLYFLTLFILPLDMTESIDRHFYNPFYGAFEQFLYLSTFFAYTYFAYRYVLHKRHRVEDKIEARKVLYMEKLIQILFFFFAIHSVFVVADFIAFEFFNINLRTVKPYAALGALSFAAMVYWLSVYAFQVLLWGRKLFKRSM
ncbi:MAG: hypothetical protein R3350_04455 [Saprospiraceae bacterium]|nr:hypothetical protein [Saprospiraceae bacterium]